MLDELLLAPPGVTLEVIVLKGMYEDLRLIQPGGMGRSVPRLPPPITLVEVGLCPSAGVARPPGLDKENSSQFPMLSPELLQLGDEMLLVVLGQKRRRHLARMHDQEHQ